MTNKLKVHKWISIRKSAGILCLYFFWMVAGNHLGATNYYVHPQLGDDQNQGTSMLAPIKSLDKAGSLPLEAGDLLLLAAGYTHHGMLSFNAKKGDPANPIRIASYQWGNTFADPRAIINASQSLHGIMLEDCSHIRVEDIIIEAGNSDGSSSERMKCGVLVITSSPGAYRDITLSNLLVRDIYIEAPGFRRGEDEVRTANGVQRYGWGLRFINRTAEAEMKGLTVINCVVSNVSHTGIKLTSEGQHLHDIRIVNNRVSGTGGPGIQMSGGSAALFANNHVSDSGSNDDTRKWGRGSGLWVWGSSDVVIERNYFLHANGPGDSAGCHIDFNCRDVVVQYNFSAYNAGGFCEILGNNFNCAYRYNISVNDGHRVKGVNGAFQEGKTIWLSGYVGNRKKRSGPFNSYIYNNTIYASKDIVSKIAISKVAEGVLIANNIFYVEGESRAVMGDQYVPEKGGEAQVRNVFFSNNLYLLPDYWPEDVWIQDAAKIIGDPDFLKRGSMEIMDYMPRNKEMITDQGIDIPMIQEDTVGLKIGLLVKYDILGNPIKGKPDLGAIELGSN